MAEISSAEIADYPNKSPEAQQAFREKVADMLAEVQGVVSESDFAEIQSKTGFIPNP